jgi:hypothetical protein
VDFKKETRNSFLKRGVGFAILYVIIKWTLIGTVGTLLYRSGNWSNWYLLAIPVIGWSVMGVRRYRKKRSGE